MRGRYHSTTRLAAVRMCRSSILFLVLAVVATATGARAGGPMQPVSFYVDTAFANNPSLASMQERIRAKENAAVVAGALDDPKLRFGISNVPVRSWSFREEDMTGKEIGLSQMFPYPGKRKLRTEVVSREKEQTEFDLQEMRNMLRSEIKMAYAELAFVRRQSDVVRGSQAVMRETIAVSREMYTVGKTVQSDVLRAQVELGRMQDMLLTLENREKVLSIRLNTLAALSPDRAVPPLEDLPEFRSPLRPEELVEIYKGERPARKALQARVDRGEAAVALAKKEYYPDFEVGVSYMQRDDMPDGTRRPDMFSSMVEMNLPIWRKEKLAPAVREMEAEKRMAVRELENLDLETSNRVGNTVATVENRAELAALYRTTLIPQAEQTFQANVEAYQVGTIDFPTLVDAIIAVLNFRRDYLGMLMDQYVTKAQLEAAVGRELK